MDRQISIDRLHIRLSKAPTASGRKLADELGPELLRSMGRNAALREARGTVKADSLRLHVAEASTDRQAAAAAKQIAKRLAAVVSERRG